MGGETPLHRSVLWVNQFANSPGEGGGSRHFEVGRGLVRLGWTVTVAASDFQLLTRRYTRRESASNRESIAESLDGVGFLWLWAAAYERNDWHRAWNWISFGRSVLRHDFSNNRPDVVIGSSPQLFAALAAERLARRLHVPFVFEVRDLWPESLVAVGSRKGPAYHALRQIAGHLYRRAVRIIVLAQGTGEHLRSLGVSQDKLVFIPNGADVDFFTPGSRASRDGFTMVYAGAHGPANGLDVVLDTADLLKERHEVRFLLVGDGPSKASLVAEAERRGLVNVEFRNAVPRRDIPALFASVDAGLMVLSESPLFEFGVSPNKLFDYCAAGLPIVCNVPGEVATLVREAGAGVQTADHSPQALADAVVELADQPLEKRRSMGMSARGWVRREHSRAVLAERLDHVLHPLIKSPSNSK